MNRPAARIGMLAFGSFVALGSLVGWALGEAALALARAPEAVRSPDNPGPPESKSPSPSGPGPTPPVDFAARLARAGAQAGEVQMVLIWDDANDLDLHCVGPDGHDIYSATRDTPSPTGGRLDVDARTGCYAPEGAPPAVENVYWPGGRAAAGMYRVYVNGHERCPAGGDTTRFRVAVLYDGRWREFDGAVTFSARAGRQLVHEFELAPRPGAEAAPDAPAPATPAAPAPTLRAPGALLQGGWAALVAGALMLGVAVGSNYRLGVRPLVSRAGGWAAVGAAFGLAAGGTGAAIDHQVHASGGRASGSRPGGHCSADCWAGPSAPGRPALS